MIYYSALRVEDVLSPWRIIILKEASETRCWPASPWSGTPWSRSWLSTMFPDQVKLSTFFNKFITVSCQYSQLKYWISRTPCWAAGNVWNFCFLNSGSLQRDYKAVNWRNVKTRRKSIDTCALKIFYRMWIRLHLCETVTIPTLTLFTTCAFKFK